MNISWDITEIDINQVKKVLKNNDNSFLQKRRERNIEKQNIVIDQNTIVKTLLMCLLTSQQRSGPNTPIGQFLRLSPFPITIESINQENDIQTFIRSILKENGLNRYINNISHYFAENMIKIQNNNWSILEKLNRLNDQQTKLAERELADYLNDWLKGFGPKQSRNFLQALGLTKYEIPIDSRITNWLNKFGFPVTLISSPLSDKGYYHFVSDGIQVLCEKADIYPCLLDAAIFSSYDNEEWTKENTIF